MNVINYILSMEKPQKLTLQNADKMLSKLRKLVADNPVELLIHHVQLLDKIFGILAIEYSNTKESFNDANKIEHDEDRQDVAFEILLLMIDLFYAVFPQFKHMFVQYLEEHFYQPHVFVALTNQMRMIGSVFKVDISNANRFWLMQTLSYIPIIIKILRISFIQHQRRMERQQKEQMD